MAFIDHLMHFVAKYQLCFEYWFFFLFCSTTMDCKRNWNIVCEYSKNWETPYHAIKRNELANHVCDALEKPKLQSDHKNVKTLHSICNNFSATFCHKVWSVFLPSLQIFTPFFLNLHSLYLCVKLRVIQRVLCRNIQFPLCV